MSTSYAPPSILPSPPAGTQQDYYGRPPPHDSSTGPPTTAGGGERGGGGPTDGASQAAKMFVGGLPQSVTSESLRDYFSRFGSVAEAFVLMDETSGRSRGFGFVTFDSPQTLRQVLSSRPHVLDNKQVDCKHAVMKGQTAKDQARMDHRQPAPDQQQQQQQPANNAWTQATMPVHLKVMAPPPVTSSPMDPFAPGPYAPPPLAVPDRNAGGGQSHSSSANGSSATGDQPGIDLGIYDDEQDFFLTGGGKSYLALSGDKWLEDCAEADERKIFVGGLPDVTPAEFASFFEHFGPVADAMVMFDRKRRRQRGFGFITFATNDGVQNALQYHRHPVKGKLVEVKKAHPLVLQKARAPARRERDLALQAMMVQNPTSSQQGQEMQTNWPVVKPETAPWGAPPPQAMVDPFGISNSSAAPGTTAPCLRSEQLPQFPSAPWNTWRQPYNPMPQQGPQRQRANFDDRSNPYGGGGGADYGGCKFGAGGGGGGGGFYNMEALGVGPPGSQGGYPASAESFGRQQQQQMPNRPTEMNRTSGGYMASSFGGELLR